MGLWPVGSPYNSTRMECFGYIHTGVLWVLRMFFEHRIARYRMHTQKGSVMFMCGHYTGSLGFYTGLGIRLCMRAPCGCHKWAFLSVAWPIEVQLLVFFCSSVPVVLFGTPGISGCRSQHVPVESSSLLHHSIYL